MKKLYFKYGTMNSGKTMEILRTAYNHEENGFKIALIKPGVDLKGNEEIVSRNGSHRKVDYKIPFDKLPSDIINLKSIDAILVDEAQFLSKEQIDDLWLITKEKNITVFCYGLKTDFRSNGFPGAIRLFEIADKIEEITTLCKCGNKAMFNLRKNDGIPTFYGDIVLIDGITNNITYEPVCGICYIKELKKSKEKGFTKQTKLFL